MPAADRPTLELYQAEWCPYSHRVRMRPLAIRRPGDVVALRPERGLRAVVDADLAEDLRQVPLDRPLRDPQAAGDLLVGAAGRDERQDVALALRQGGDGRRVRRRR